MVNQRREGEGRTREKARLTGETDLEWQNEGHTHIIHKYIYKSYLYGIVTLLMDVTDFHARFKYGMQNKNSRKLEIHGTRVLRMRDARLQEDLQKTH